MLTQNMIDETPEGGTLRLPAGEYEVSNGFIITKPIRIVGEGDATVFVGSLPADTDLFHIVIPASTVQRNFGFSLMRFRVENARSWIHIDTMAAADTYLQGLVVSDIRAEVNPVKYGIWAQGLSNGAGLSQAVFERLSITVDGASPNCCIMLDNVGDSIHISNGMLSGTAYGIWLKQVPGAGGFNLIGTNITSLGGIVVQSATQPVFQDFEIELSNYNLVKLQPNSGFVASGAGIYFLATDGASIGPGQIQAIYGSVNFNEAIYISSNSHNVIVNNMRLSSTVRGDGIVVAYGAQGTKITNNAFGGFVRNTVGI